MKSLKSFFIISLVVATSVAVISQESRAFITPLIADRVDSDDSKEYDYMDWTPTEAIQTEIKVLNPERGDTFFRLNKTYKLLSWNIFKMRRPAFFEEIARYSKGVDILTLQETSLRPNLVDFINQTPLAWYAAVSFYQPNPLNAPLDEGDLDEGNLDEGNAVLSVADEFQTDITNAPHPDGPFYATGVTTAFRFRADSVKAWKNSIVELFVKTPKTFSVTSIPIQGVGQSLLVVNMHMLVSRGMASYRKNFSEILSKIVHHSGPIILAGDFNTWSNQRKNYLAETMKRLGFVDAPISAADFLSDEKKRDIAYGRAKGRKYNLDHILVRGVQVTDFTLLHDVVGSDHPALSIEFHIPHNY